MTIRIELFKENDLSLVNKDFPKRVYVFRTNDGGVCGMNYIRKPNDLEDQLKWFIEDYLDVFKKEIE